MTQTSSGNYNQSSSATHRVLQKSSTLNRRYVKRPGAFNLSSTEAPAKEPQTIKINVESKAAAEQRRQILVEEMKQAHEQLVQKHRMKITVQQIDNDSGLEQAISQQAERAAAQPQPAPVRIPVEDAPDLPPEPNPYQAALDQHHHVDTADLAPQLTAQELKNQAIAAALQSVATEQPAAIHSQSAKATKAKLKATKAQAKTAKAQAKAAKQAQKQLKKASRTIHEDDSALAKSFKKQKRRSTGAKFLLAFATSAACIAALGYFVHINMPDISVRVAAMQTGIEATYPNYIPRDYQLGSVATDQDNRVIMEFTGPEGAKFKLTEEKSSWDSNALLNNFVKTNWGINYTVVREQGITIYISNDADASWVNGGLLYTLDSDGQLTKKQIKNIVTSL